MEYKSYFKRQIVKGLACGIGVAVAGSIFVTSVLWWEVTFDGTSWDYMEEIELHCYKTLEKTDCNQLFDTYKEENKP
jgi:hypothetical protein